MSFRRVPERQSLHAALVAAVALAVAFGAVGCSSPAPTPRPELPTASPSASPLAAPTPVPSPSPSVSVAAGPTPLNELVLTPEGMNGLMIGQPIPETMATFDAHGCRTEDNASLFDEYSESDPIWNAYLPVYPPFVERRDGYEYTRYPFDAHHAEDGTLRWLLINSPEISTDRGIHVGSSESDVLAAYPDAVVFDEGSAGWYQTYNIESATGRLVIEVTYDDFGSDGPRDVWMMRLDPLDWSMSSLGGGDAGGFCALTV